MSDQKTHYRKAFDSPYLSSADVVEPITVTLASVVLASDQTKKSKDQFNTASFVEKEIRPGEKLKPMILNATNSKIMKDLTGSPFIDDWAGTTVRIYVDHNVRFGRETVEGLRIDPRKINKAKQEVTPGTALWEGAKNALKRDGNLDKVKAKATISAENEAALVAEVETEAASA